MSIEKLRHRATRAKQYKRVSLSSDQTQSLVEQSRTNIRFCSKHNINNQRYTDNDYTCLCDVKVILSLGSIAGLARQSTNGDS